MQKDDLPLRDKIWLMLDNQNARCRIDPILFVCAWKSPLVYLSRPKVACDCKQVRISKQRVKFWLQT
jgi:hypothetical protein